jgi:hypothetical protein
MKLWKAPDNEWRFHQDESFEEAWSEICDIFDGAERIKYKDCLNDQDCDCLNTCKLEDILHRLRGRYFVVYNIPDGTVIIHEYYPSKLKQYCHEILDNIKKKNTII